MYKHSTRKFDHDAPITNSHCSVSEDHAGTLRIILVYIRGKINVSEILRTRDTITCHYCRHRCVRLSFYYRATLHRRPVGRCGRLTPRGSRRFKKSDTKVSGKSPFRIFQDELSFSTSHFQSANEPIIRILLSTTHCTDYTHAVDYRNTIAWNFWKVGKWFLNRTLPWIVITAIVINVLFIGGLWSDLQEGPRIPEGANVYSSSTMLPEGCLLVSCFEAIVYHTRVAIKPASFELHSWGEIESSPPATFFSSIHIPVAI